MTNKFMLAGIMLLISMFLAGCADHIHDPWVAPDSMQAQRSVGLQHQEQLSTRLLTGQSDR